MRNITPAFRLLLKRTFPDMEFKVVIRPMRMGLLRPQTRPLRRLGEN